jgi:hypothetical protein
MHEERISALGALYQAEKADAAGLFNVGMVMMGIAVAYIVGALGYADKYGTRSLPWVLVALAPTPLWIIMAFQSILTLTSMMHGVSVQIIENVLFEETGLDKELRNYVGSRGADEIMDIRKSHWAHGIATIFVYAGVVAAILGFTVYALSQAWEHLTLEINAGIVAGYFVAAVVVALSWVHGLKKVASAGEHMNSAQRPT